jgi:glyoxylase-like metal-dependent hydrolase (beta-lactamase superfamily II)
MRTHHLNCGSHCPLGGCLFDGASRRLFADIPTHCLLIETNAGLVLVDTGYGLQDVQRPHSRLPWLWPAILNVRLKEADTALRQVEALGYKASDIRHIILTHLDFDHAGGIEDFPGARVHVLGIERAAAARHRGFVGGQRYRPGMWDDVGDWRLYAPVGESWFGFDAVRQLDGLPPEILMVPLRGHTAGHAGVAIASGTGWLLHAGDAYLHRGQMEERPVIPPGLRVYQHVMDTDRPARRRNQQRLRELHAARPRDVRIFCSHDRHELEALQHASQKPDQFQKQPKEGVFA